MTMEFRNYSDNAIASQGQIKHRATEHTELSGLIALFSFLIASKHSLSGVARRRRYPSFCLLPFAF